MKKFDTVAHYIDGLIDWKAEVLLLQELCIEAGLEETLKWSVPVYTMDQKNVVGIAAFKNYVGLWFFNGSFLNDPYKKLINAQEGTTKALLQWRFEKMEDIKPNQILEYLQEAITNEKAGIKLKINRNRTLVLPPILAKSLSENTDLFNAFENFTPFKKREFADYIAQAKRDETKSRRLEKCIPLILEGIGLNDKYRRTTMQ